MPSRLVIWHTAWLLDQGQRAGHESSIAKVVCSEAIWRIVAHRSMQIFGGLGITDDTIVARLFRERSAHSASTTARPKSTAGRSPAASCSGGTAAQRQGFQLSLKR